MSLDRMVSARKVVSRRVLILVLFLVVASAAAWMSIESSSFLYLIYVTVSLALGVVGVSTLVWMMHAWRTPESLAESRLEADGREPAHSFSLIVPARHEEAVLETTLTRLIGSDHPDFEVLVVVGPDDPGTREVAERMADRHPERIRVVVDPSWPKSKPKALNAALPFCSGTITGVFDAEDDVHPALLPRVDQCFQATDADIVQAGVQLMNFRSSWFTVHNVLEYYFWFRSRLHVHARQRFIPLGGNTVFVRTPILRAAAGWADCLAEDCELGVRLSALGARTAVFYEPELVTREECPPTLRAFIRQRTRWNQGYLQTLARGYWRRLPTRQRWLGAYILANPYVMALAWLMIPLAIATAAAVKAPIVITLVSFLPLLPMLSMLVAEGVGLGEFCRLYGERPSVRDYTRLVLGLLIYQAVLAFAAARAVVREARGARGWEKTAHLGLHLAEKPAGVAARSGASLEGLPQRAAARVSAVRGMLAWSAPALRTAALGVLPRLARRVPPATPIPYVIEPRPAVHARAERLTSLDEIVGAHADAPVPTPIGRPADDPHPRENLHDWPTADGGNGNGHGELRPDSIDHLFGATGGEPLWARLDGGPAAGPRVLPPPRIPLGGAAARASRAPGPIRAVLRWAVASRADLVVQLLLLTVAGVVVGTNLTHWPGTQFDEGTYVDYAWAVQHDRLANYTYSYGHPPSPGC